MNKSLGLEIEMQLLGSLLSRPESAALCQLEPEHFLEPLHARIFNAIRQQNAASFTIIARKLEDDAGLREVGGTAYLAGLVGMAATEVTLKDYANTVRDMAAKRSLRSLFEAAAVECAASSSQRSADQIAADINGQMIAVGESACDATSVQIADGLDKAIDAANAIFSGEKDKTRIDIGFAKLEALTGGVRRGELIVAGARPGMGKSALAVSIVANAAARGHKVLLLSLEMNAIDIGRRYLSNALYKGGRVEYARMRSGPIDASEITRMCDVCADHRSLSLWLDDISGASLNKVLARIAVQRMKTGLDLVVVDYLGLIQANERGRTKVEEVGEISGALKAAAKKNGIAVIAMHQLSRAVEHREQRRPVLSDLRDSGNIEQDCDQVWFPYREAYYTQQELATFNGDSNARIDIENRFKRLSREIEINIAKHRHGQIGIVKMFCDIASNVIADTNPQFGDR